MTRPKKSQTTAAPSIPRIEYLRVENFRALRRVELSDITPLTVLLGPNGSGKSTIFDVFNFLSECFQVGLRKAWDKRGRFTELRTRGSSGPIVIEVRYREQAAEEPATYRLEIDEVDGHPRVRKETLQWRRVPKNQPGAPYKILSFDNGKGWVISGPQPGPKDRKTPEELNSPDALAVSTLGQLAKHPRVAALRRFIADWYVSYLSVEDTRDVPLAGAHERLSKTGDNLANVLQFLQENHPDRLKQIFAALAKRVPRLEKVSSEPLRDGRLLLRIKDAPFAEPVLARFVSDGTLKMLAYLVVLFDPKPPQFIGLEEPENFLHPRLLTGLAEECRAAAERSQFLVTTHSPYFVNGVRPDELRVLYRDERGHTKVVRASDQRGVVDFVDEGAALGDLWMEGHLGGDPLVRAGAPRT
ncbi:MAG: AAA family ATPase [Myxococcaceae bacterium]|nr:AAA family ATPase [Myxococcaceae bacterium]